jgi:hypothetical protein
LAGAGVTGTFLGVVDDEDGGAMAPLQLASEQWGNFAAGVLVDAVQPYEGIEDQQAWLEVGNSVGEAAPIGVEIEPERRGGNNLLGYA